MTPDPQSIDTAKERFIFSDNDMQSRHVHALCDEVDRLRLIAEWARSVGHQPGCSGGYSDVHGLHKWYHCKCGRRELFGEGIDDAPTFAKVDPLGPPRNSSSSRWAEGTDDD